MVDKWDKKTSEAITEAGCEDALSEFRKDLEKGVKLRIKYKALTTEAEGLKKQADELFGPAFMVSGISRIGIPGLQPVYWKDGSNTNLSGKKIVEYLVMNGVDPGLAADAIAAGTTKKTYKYFQLQQK